VLPGVATSELEALNSGPPGPLPVQGLDGTTIGVRAAVTASALPQLGSDAVMVDLGLVSLLQVAPLSPSAADQVWLGPHAPRDAVAALTHAGLRPEAVQRSSAVFATLQHSGPALADDFLLAATLAALLIAIASTLATLGATTRERATELSSLEVAGIRRPVLLRSLGLESAILLGTALCGAVVGSVAAALAIPSLPELATGSFAPLSYSLPVPVIGAVTLITVAAVALAAGAVATVLVRRMSPLLLRAVTDET
jgi:putative ABC transport system permease protein